MGKWNEMKEKAGGFEIRKSWQYLLYITVVLPVILFLLAFVLKDNSFGVTLGRIFHTYGLYVSSPIPNFSPFNGTGVLGLAILIFLAVWAVRRRDWADLGITLGLGAVNALYFAMGWNYAILPLLNLAGTPF
jgi:hypothetical protein